MSILYEMSKNKTKIKQEKIYIEVITLIFLEYINSLLRYFAIIDMAFGVLIRKIIFIIIFLILFSNLTKKFAYYREILYPKKMLSMLIMYVWFVFVYITRSNAINITDLSNLCMPFLVGILGYKSAFPSIKKYNIFWEVYYISIFVLYITNVYNGAYQYSSVGLNSIYYIVLIFPMLFLINNKVIKKILICCTIISTILSLKATVIVLVFGMLAIFYCLNNRKIIVNILLFPIVGLIIFGIIEFISNKYLSISIIEYYVKPNISDGGNGRISIWKNILSHIENSSFSYLFFGHGYDAVASVTGSSAHNDFLEVLFDYGVVGLGLLLWNFVKLIKIGVRMFKTNYRFTTIYFMIIFEIFTIFLFSNILFVASYILIVIINIFMLNKDFYMELNLRNSQNSLSFRFIDLDKCYKKSEIKMRF